MSMKPKAVVPREICRVFLFVAMFAARVAVGQPNLVSVQPDFESIDVPLNTQIVFLFDTPMNTHSLLVVSENRFPAGSLTFSGNVLATSFVVQWNEDATVLTLSSANLLPSGTEVTWKFNPPDAEFPLVDKNGNPVPATTGLFTTIGDPCDPDGLPGDHGSIFLVKAVTYLQGGTGDSTLLSSERPVFYTSIVSPASDGIVSAALSRPGASGITLDGALGMFFWSEGFDSIAALDTAYPQGTYSCDLVRESGGTTSVVMQMPEPVEYPSIPKLANWAQARNIDSARDFKMEFNSLGNPMPADSIAIEIYDNFGRYVVVAPNLCLPIPLPNDATSFLIPANTLAPETEYTLRISFVRAFYASTTDPAQFFSSGTLQQQTVTTIRTTATVLEPQIANAGFRGGIFSFDVINLTPGVVYRVQANDSLLPEGWSNVGTLNSGTQMPIVDVTSGSITGRRFYRIAYP